MKRTTTLPKYIALLSLLWLAGGLRGQGPLTPPGPPAPMFKTLQQVEPRIPISELPAALNRSGSYYLTTNLTGAAGQHGITISASQVTLDLMGFALIGPAGSRNGIYVSDWQTNIIIRNGGLRGWGGDGVDTLNARNCQLRDLNVTHNTQVGLFVGENSIVSSCTSHANGDDGIYTSANCRVTDCCSSGNSGAGIRTGYSCSISGCTARGNTGAGLFAGSGSSLNNCSAYLNTGPGIEAESSGTIQNCSALSNSTNGISADNGSHVTACTVRRNGGYGIRAGTSCRIENNTCALNTLAQVYAAVNFTRVDGNHCVGGQRGVLVSGTGSLVIRNSVTGASVTSYDVAAGNSLAQILTPGLNFLSSNPWANFSD